MEVPAVFRQTSHLQRQMLRHSTLSKDVSDPLISPSSFVDSPELFSDLQEDSLLLEFHFALDATDISSLCPHTNLSSKPIFIPLQQSVDKPSSFLPKNITMSEDYLHASMGFCRVDTLLQHFSDLYKPTIKLDSTLPDAILDSGHFASLEKKARNTEPVPRPLRFGDVIHMAIVFGPKIAIGNTHYGLLLTVPYSQMTYLYPLHNLTSDIPKQLDAFFARIGMVPRHVNLNFNVKLTGGKALEFLNSLLIHVNAAPALCQDKNGLAERHWQTMVSMAHNWLALAELPVLCCPSCSRSL